MRHRPTAICRYGNTAIISGLAVYFFIMPAAIIVFDLNDPYLRDGRIPACAFRWHRALSPKYERWACERVASGAADELDLYDIAGTEWPVFGSVFYLWATEALQAEYERHPDMASAVPRDYAAGAIEAAAALVADPGHATWVKQHWGEDYLHTENVFYRTLLIAGLTSHYKLTGNEQYLPILRDQVETLSQALDESPFGLLDDYPGECYPTDVVGAIGVIRRADEVLGTDHSAFVQRAIRGFQGSLLDPVGLPPYSADPDGGRIHGRSRGCGNSFLLTFVPEIWPDIADSWYDAYETHFWQHKWTAVGFREFPKDEPDREWYMDVDSGPVLAGHGFAACAFGVGTARVYGRFDHAYPLSAEMLVTSWPLLDGTLLGPRVLSNAIDAPYLGEAGVLFALTRQPTGDVKLKPNGALPGFVYILLTGYFGIGLLLVLLAFKRVRVWRRRRTDTPVPAARTQLGLWLGLVLVGCTLILAGNVVVGGVLMLGAQFLPRFEKLAKKVTPVTAESEPAC